MTFVDRFDLGLQPYNAFADLEASINEPFRKLDTNAGHLRLAQTWTDENIFAGTLRANGQVNLAAGSRLNWPSGDYIEQYSAGGLRASSFTVTPGQLAAAGLTVNGNSQLNGALNVSSNLNVGGAMWAAGSIRGNPHFFEGSNVVYWSWDGWIHGSHQVLIDGMLQTRSRLVTNNWDVNWANNLGGNAIVAGRFVSNNWDVGWANCLGGDTMLAGRLVTSQWDVGWTNCLAGTTAFQSNVSVGGNLNTGGSATLSGGLNLPVAAQGHRPPYVLGQNGDGWAYWYAVDLVGRPAPPIFTVGGSVAQMSTGGLWVLNPLSIGAGWDTGDGRIVIPAGYGGFITLTVVVTINDNTPMDNACAFRLVVNGGAINTPYGGPIWARLPRQYIGQALWGTWVGLWPPGTVLELQFGNDIQDGGRYVRQEGGSLTLVGQPLWQYN